jgi:Flp pilus assembly pilin Flp
MLDKFRLYILNDHGGAAIEYGLLIAVTGIAIAGASTSFRSNILDGYAGLAQNFGDYTKQDW